jgi:hypothetical protein
MKPTSLVFEELAEKVEAKMTLTGSLAQDVAEAINYHLPENASGMMVKAADLSSTDYVLHLIDTVTPGWTIRLRGKAMERDGHWQCSLRPTDARDEAEFIGHAHGPDLSNSLVGALLRVLAYQTRRAGAS